MQNIKSRNEAQIFNYEDSSSFNIYSKDVHLQSISQIKTVRNENKLSKYS